MNTITGCCKGCKDRHPACHDTCEKYIKARDEWLEKKSVIAKAKAEPLYLYKIQSIRDQKAKKDKRSLKK